MEFIYQDSSILVCVKPAGVLSTDEPGGMPELDGPPWESPRAACGPCTGLDRVVSGLMVLARTPEAASQLSRQIREQRFEKEYLAVLHGCPQAPEGALRDLLRRDKAERKTYVTEVPGKDVQEAILSYRLLGSCNGLSQVHIRLQTGRTHQIRAQFSARGLPLVGDRKYSLLDDGCPIALWSHCLRFCHPVSGKPMTFRLEPPPIFPWTLFCD